MKQEVASLSNFVQQVSAKLHEWVSVCLFFFPWPYSVKACVGREMDYLNLAYPAPPAHA